MNFEDWKQKYGLLKIECKQQEPEPWKGETDLRNKYLIDVEFKMDTKKLFHSGTQYTTTNKEKKPKT
jgi:hypothetical protein